MSQSTKLRWLAIGGSGVALLACLGLWLTFGSPWSNGAAMQQPPRDLFAQDRPEPPKAAAFDGKRAMGYLEAICKIGPRISGSEGMTKQQELIQKHFEKLGATVEFQRFKAKQKSQRDETPMANIIVSWNPQAERRILLCSHYDTRPIADQEEDKRLWGKPFISANDGGSGVALMMELGNHMRDLKLQVGVDFVFFDGEEMIFLNDQDLYFFGSKHFGSEYRKQKKFKYQAGVLLDMIAGKDATFPVEQNSWWKADWLIKEVYSTARMMGVKNFKEGEFSRVAVEDDHIPLNNSGIPTIDLIDFDYHHWHRLTDTPENCSTETMTNVAKVLSVWMQLSK
jgi:hypothetical protein